MAWCPYCKENNQISRQCFDGKCPYCGATKDAHHFEDCRGPAPGWLDVCSYCNSSLFAQARNEEEYDYYEIAEYKAKAIRQRNRLLQIIAGGCVIIFIALSDTSKPSNNFTHSDKKGASTNKAVTAEAPTKIVYYGIVNTPNGVVVREKPNRNSKQLCSLEDRAEFKVLDLDSGPTEIIENKLGSWLYIEAGNVKGWVFGGLVTIKTRAEVIR